MIVVVPLAVVMGGFLLLYLLGRMTKGKAGMVFPDPGPCPSCKTPLPRGPRWPSDFREALWGGWTCGVCGQKIDAKGRAKRAS